PSGHMQQCSCRTIRSLKLSPGTASERGACIPKCRTAYCDLDDANNWMTPIVIRSRCGRVPCWAVDTASAKRLSLVAERSSVCGIDGVQWRLAGSRYAALYLAMLTSI